MRIHERVFPEIQTHTQASGRHSIVGPPLGTLPGFLEKLILPDPGKVVLSFDWDQIELRLLACHAMDRPLIEAFSLHYDVHLLTACELFGLEYPALRSELAHTDPTCEPWRRANRWSGKGDKRRRFSKVFVYRLAYGADPELAGDIPGATSVGLVGDTAIAASRRFLAVHPAIPAYHRRLAETLHVTGTARSHQGRLCRFTAKEGREAERAAFDHPMQGGCTDIYEETLIELDRLLYPQAEFWYGVHDSQKWEFEESLLGTSDGEKLIGTIKEVATRTRAINGIEMDFPITCDIIRGNGEHEPYQVV